MVTKNSADDEKSPMRNTRSFLMPSHAGASKDTWCNLKHTEGSAVVKSYSLYKLVSIALLYMYMFNQEVLVKDDR